jgi:4-aminobutyrate aminotransferase-like enzyme
MEPMKLPGPKAQALINRDSSVISPSYPRGYPFVMDHGKGSEVWDVDGNRFLDFAAGIAVASTGQNSSISHLISTTNPGSSWERNWMRSHHLKKPLFLS